MPPVINWVTGDGASYHPTNASTSLVTYHRKGSLYLFMDESGNLDFGRNGSRCFFMTCVVVWRPFALELPLTSLRYDFIEDGIPIEAFHACEDKPDVRRAVLKRIGQESRTIKAYTICIDKRDLPQEMRKPETLYSKAFEWITSEVCDREDLENADNVIVITDDLPKMSKQKMVVKPLKEFMKRRFQSEGIPYMLLHHKSCASVYLQIADYLSWAVQRKETSGERWPMDLVSSCFEETGRFFSAEQEEGDLS